MQARECLEPTVAALAAENATPEDVAAMWESAHLADTIEEQVQLDIDFHLSLAKAAHNRVLALMLHSVHELFREISLVNLGRGTPPEHVISGHRAILQRVVEHDVEGARQLMQEHLQEVRRGFIV